MAMMLSNHPFQKSHSVLMTKAYLPCSWMLTSSVCACSHVFTAMGNIGER